MELGPVCLNAEDAVELGELLEVLGEWLCAERIVLAPSLRRFRGVDGYDADELRRDLARFVFLLGVGHGESLFEEDVRWRPPRRP